MKETLLPRLPLAHLFASGILVCAAACGDGEAASGALPGDKQVVADVTPEDKDGLLDVSVTDGRRGEAYFHRGDMNWYWDRGVVIKRRAVLDGAPDAVVVIGGLARYVLTGDRYKYYKFLSTYNEYEGIPAPEDGELTKFVERNLGKVFAGRDHTITEVSSVDIAGEGKWIWHSATSFTVPFTIAYKYKNSYTTIESRRDLFDVRFYREGIDSAVNNLLATEKGRELLGTERFAPEQLDSIETLRGAR
jgi:hypothetical protein